VGISDEGETDMTSAVVSNIDKIRELNEAGGGLSNNAWIAIGVVCALGCAFTGGAAAALIVLL
jgi:hypothetical protein